MCEKALGHRRTQPKPNQPCCTCGRGAPDPGADVGGCEGGRGAGGGTGDDMAGVSPDSVEMWQSQRRCGSPSADVAVPAQMWQSQRRCGRSGAVQAVAAARIVPGQLSEGRMQSRCRQMRPRGGEPTEWSVLPRTRMRSPSALYTRKEGHQGIHQAVSPAARYSDSRYPYSDSRYRYSDYRYRYSDFRYRYSDSRYRYSDSRYRYSDYRYSYSDYRHRYSDCRYRYSDYRYRYSENRYRYSDYRYQMYTPGQ